LFSSTQS